MRPWLAVTLGAFTIAAASWVISHGWLICTAIAVVVLFLPGPRDRGQTSATPAPGVAGRPRSGSPGRVPSPRDARSSHHRRAEGAHF